jgi:hypothetical protein
MIFDIGRSCNTDEMNHYKPITSIGIVYTGDEKLMFGDLINEVNNDAGDGDQSAMFRKYTPMLEFALDGILRDKIVSSSSRSSRPACNYSV